MSNRELRALGLGLPGDATGTATSDTTTVDATIDSATMAITATQVNPCHDVADLSSPEEKTLCQKATEGLPNDKKYDGNAKDIIKFVERVEGKGEDFGWNSIAINIAPDDTGVFNTPGKLIAEDCKKYCDPKWTDGLTASNLQFCIKPNLICLFIKNSAHQSVLDNMKEERIH